MQGSPVRFPSPVLLFGSSGRSGGAAPPITEGGWWKKEKKKQGGPEGQPWNRQLNGNGWVTICQRGGEAGMHWKGGGGATPPPPPGRPAYAQPLSPQRQVPASMAFVADNNRPQPLWQPPPTTCLTAAGATSQVRSLLMHPSGEGRVPGPGAGRTRPHLPGRKSCWYTFRIPRIPSLCRRRLVDPARLRKINHHPQSSPAQRCGIVYQR